MSVWGEGGIGCGSCFWEPFFFLFQAVCRLQQTSFLLEHLWRTHFWVGDRQRLSMTYQKKKTPLKHKSDWSPATLKTSTRRMSSFSDCLHSCCLWSQYCKTTLNCTGISKRMLRTGMAAPGAGQDLGVLTELGHPCSRCATEIQAWSCCTPVPGLTVGLSSHLSRGVCRGAQPKPESDFCRNSQIPW